jgi:hypothetical protein
MYLKIPDVCRIDLRIETSVSFLASISLIMDDSYSLIEGRTPNLADRRD